MASLKMKRSMGRTDEHYERWKSVVERIHSRHESWCLNACSWHSYRKWKKVDESVTLSPQHHPKILKSHRFHSGTAWHSKQNYNEVSCHRPLKRTHCLVEAEALLWSSSCSADHWIWACSMLLLKSGSHFLVNRSHQLQLRVVSAYKSPPK